MEAEEDSGLQEANAELRLKESKLQQKETELLATQRKLGEARERVEITEATCSEGLIVLNRGLE